MLSFMVLPKKLLLVPFIVVVALVKTVISQLLGLSVVLGRSANTYALVAANIIVISIISFYL